MLINIISYTCIKVKRRNVKGPRRIGCNGNPFYHSLGLTVLMNMYDVKHGVNIVLAKFDHIYFLRMLPLELFF